MGLDVYAYRKVREFDENSDDDTKSERGVMLCPAEFPEQAEGLNGVYTYEERMYVFSCGYHRYNTWREDLAILAGYPLTDADHRTLPPSHAMACWAGATDPFSELINFSDCEGVIGPVTAAKLLTDFKDFNEKAKRTLGIDGYERYEAMMCGLEMAADGGAIRFS